MSKILRLKLTFLALLTAVFAVNAELHDYSLNVQDFSELTVTDAINVEYRCSADSAGWAFFTCEPSLTNMLMFSNNKDKLRIQLSNDGEVIKNLPTILVYSSTLTKLENAGDSTVTANHTASVPTLKIKVVGNGTIIAHNLNATTIDAGINTGCGHLVVSGTAKRVNLKNVGTGPVEAGGLVAEEGKCTVLGTGPIDCTISDKLSVAGAGTGKVYYNGNPQVTNRSLGIKAIRVDK
jgi:hypothetical protein